MKHALKNQKGGASLLVTIILAVILLGVVGGLATLSLRELRQASNTEQSAKALAAAESYVDIVADKISRGVATGLNEGCGPGDKLGDSFITCASVSQGASSDITGVLRRDESFRIDLSGAYSGSNPTSIQRVKYVMLEWGADEYSTILSTAMDSFPPLKGGESWQYQAAPEVTTVAWNGDNGKIRPIDLNSDSYGLPINKFVLMPGVNSAKDQVKSSCSLALYPRCRTESDSHKPGYSVGESKDNMVYKLTARYNGMNYRLRFYDESGDLLSVPRPYAVIDVTARSNNLYRRVVAQKVLSPSQAFGFLDGNVVFSGGNICKNLKVGEDYSPINGGDGKNTVNCE